MSKICTSCNAENVDEAKFCRRCGNMDFNNIQINTVESIKEIKKKKEGTYAVVFLYFSVFGFLTSFFFDEAWITATFLLLSFIATFLNF